MKDVAFRVNVQTFEFRVNVQTFEVTPKQWVFTTFSYPPHYRPQLINTLILDVFRNMQPNCEVRCR